MEASVTPKPWQGTFLVLLTPKVILSATSDKYLEQVLANLDVVPTVQAFPDTLPEWKHVDTTAPAWMLRHVPESTAERTLDGVTMTGHRDYCRITYLARSKKKQDPKTFIHDRWSSKVSIEELAKQLEIEQAIDGAISVRCGLNAFEIDGATLGWRVCSLAGEK
jgi:hypothetical protein